MKINFKEQTKDNIIAFSTSGIIILIAYFVFSNWSSAKSFLSTIWGAILPFIIGFCIAFIMLPLKKLIEEKWFKSFSWSANIKRNLAIALSMIILLALVSLFFAILIPQLVSSGQMLASQMGGYMEQANKLIDQLLGSNPEVYSFLEGAYQAVVDALTSWLTDSSGAIPAIINYGVTFVSTIVNIFIGLFVAVYILIDKNKFKRQAKKLCYATMSKERAEYWFGVGHLTARMFNRFIFGKALDSFIVGVVCWIVTSIMQLPYAPLISFVIGVTNMIPVFGPFIGAIPCIFILLIIDPFQALEFAVFILILQQIDGNILGPYILGDSMGLPTLWVMFAIILGGSMFGVIGMFIGVPLFSVLYILIRNKVESRLKEKQIEVK